MEDLKNIAAQRLERKLKALREEAKQRKRYTLAQHFDECLWLLSKATTDARTTD
jgi:hypothetical protein